MIETDQLAHRRLPTSLVVLPVVMIEVVSPKKYGCPSKIGTLAHRSVFVVNMVGNR